VAIHPGARDARRRWPAERFAEVADVLTDTGYDVVVTGERGEHDLVEQVAATARRPVRQLAGALTLGGLTGLYAECAAVVANDTGPLHLATALGTPTVGIYWLSNFVNCAPPQRARHRPVASWTANCPACGADNLADRYPRRGGSPGCGHRTSYLTDVPVAEVLDAVFDLLDTT
jgi:ADP-heptose:LPS heptosyltransferase